jgi:hypothetical protein
LGAVFRQVTDQGGVDAVVSLLPSYLPIKPPEMLAYFTALLERVMERLQHEFDAVLTGGIDRNMGASSFIKFCKIGALSATGSRPYAEGADGFVMGEGRGRLSDEAPRRRGAERRQDLCGAPGHRRVERRERQGNHGAEPDRPEAGDREGLANRGIVAGDRNRPGAIDRHQPIAHWVRGTDASGQTFEYLGRDPANVMSTNNWRLVK